MFYKGYEGEIFQIAYLTRTLDLIIADLLTCGCWATTNMYMLRDFNDDILNRGPFDGLKSNCFQ